ncbi:a-factor receptor [Pichia californica]|uniref:A-factor receptor n=1 Tax=Pichia californica TaxID=460514 RepID=A0A9P7BHF0_9ASCO|nr:a-factor receptor [[Candida] californica]KAG0689944.1 a-factor receptor [[Candida] californica]
MSDTLQSPKLVFTQHHVCNEIVTNSNKDISICKCKSCQIKTKILPYICILFFIGFIIPPIYLFLWGIQFYSYIAYKNQLNEKNEKRDTIDKLNDINMNSDYDYDYDDDEASSKFSNPFSDKNEVKSSNDLKTFNLKSKLNNFNTNNYNFENTSMGNLQAAFISLQAICFILNIPPLIWHLRNKNIPALTLFLYLEIMMIDGFIGAIIWGGENYTITWNGKIWCDIMVRIQFAVAVGISSCISCVSFNLLMIFLTNKLTTFWFSNKWIKPISEIFFSIIFPFFISGITYFAQSQRYVLSRYTGCYAPLVDESISILVFYLWIFFWSFIGMIICILTLILYFKRRKAAKDILLCTNSGLSVKRFMRLLIFCVLVICSSIIFSSIIGSELIINKIFFNKNTLKMKSWGFIFRLSHSSALDVNKWVLISISFVSFFIFGIGEDANKMYISIIGKLPFGNKLLNKLKLISNLIKRKFGNNLINNENKFILRFWDSDDIIDNEEFKNKDDDDDDDDNDSGSGGGGKNFEDLNSYNERSDIEMKDYDNKFYYSPIDDEFGNLDNISIDKYENLVKERIQDLGSLITPGTIKTTDTLMKYYNDENLRYQLEEAKREVEEQEVNEGRDKNLQGHSGEQDVDELKYLYY